LALDVRDFWVQPLPDGPAVSALAKVFANLRGALWREAITRQRGQHFLRLPTAQSGKHMSLGKWQNQPRSAYERPDSGNDKHNQRRPGQASTPNTAPLSPAQVSGHLLKLALAASAPSVRIRGNHGRSILSQDI
jgi:hypothetical protein